MGRKKKTDSLADKLHAAIRETLDGHYSEAEVGVLMGDGYGRSKRLSGGSRVGIRPRDLAEKFLEEVDELADEFMTAHADELPCAEGFTFNPKKADRLVRGSYGVGYYLGKCKRGNIVYDLDGGQVCFVSRYEAVRKLTAEDAEDAAMHADDVLCPGGDAGVLPDNQGEVIDFYEQLSDALDEAEDAAVPDRQGKKTPSKKLTDEQVVAKAVKMFRRDNDTKDMDEGDLYGVESDIDAILLDDCGWTGDEDDYELKLERLTFDAIKKMQGGKRHQCDPYYDDAFNGRDGW